MAYKFRRQQTSYCREFQACKQYQSGLTSTSQIQLHGTSSISTHHQNVSDLEPITCHNQTQSVPPLEPVTYQNQTGLVPGYHDRHDRPPHDRQWGSPTNCTVNSSLPCWNSCCAPAQSCSGYYNNMRSSCNAVNSGNHYSGSHDNRTTLSNPPENVNSWGNIWQQYQPRHHYNGSSPNTFTGHQDTTYSARLKSKSQNSAVQYNNISVMKETMGRLQCQSDGSEQNGQSIGKCTNTVHKGQAAGSNNCTSGCCYSKLPKETTSTTASVESFEMSWKPPHANINNMPKLPHANSNIMLRSLHANSNMYQSPHANSNNMLQSPHSNSNNMYQSPHSNSMHQSRYANSNNMHQSTHTNSNRMHQSTKKIIEHEFREELNDFDDCDKINEHRKSISSDKVGSVEADDDLSLALAVSGQREYQRVQEQYETSRIFVLKREIYFVNYLNHCLSLGKNSEVRIENEPFLQLQQYYKNEKTFLYNWISEKRASLVHVNKEDIQKVGLEMLKKCETLISNVTKTLLDLVRSHTQQSRAQVGDFCPLTVENWNNVRDTPSLPVQQAKVDGNVLGQQCYSNKEQQQTDDLTPTVRISTPQKRRLSTDGNLTVAKKSCENQDVKPASFVVDKDVYKEDGSIKPKSSICEDSTNCDTMSLYDVKLLLKENIIKGQNMSRSALSKVADQAKTSLQTVKQLYMAEMVNVQMKNM